MSGKWVETVVRASQSVVRVGRAFRSSSVTDLVQQSRECDDPMKMRTTKMPRGARKSHIVIKSSVQDCPRHKLRTSATQPVLKVCQLAPRRACASGTSCFTAVLRVTAQHDDLRLVVQPRHGASRGFKVSKPRRPPTQPAALLR